MKETTVELLDRVKSISKYVATVVGDIIGVDWSQVDIDEFHEGMKVELEHGSKLGGKTNVTKDDLVATGRIALAHLEEMPDYYTRLKKMEDQKLKEFIAREVAKLLSEGDVVDLGAFRKQKRDEEDYYNIVIVSHDGKYVFDPGEVVVTELTHRDQADALSDGDLDKAIDLGAAVLPITTTLFEKYREWQGKVR
jgi:hypothetical protein